MQTREADHEKRRQHVRPILRKDTRPSLPRHGAERGLGVYADILRRVWLIQRILALCEGEWAEVVHPVESKGAGD